MFNRDGNPVKGSGKTGFKSDHKGKGRGDPSSSSTTPSSKPYSQFLDRKTAYVAGAADEHPDGGDSVVDPDDQPQDDDDGEQQLSDIPEEEDGASDGEVDAAAEIK